jgi:serine phosphatase RsbU (regulator of sigma subunit)
MGLLSNLFPDSPHPLQLDIAETARLQSRLFFDGLATIASICLGYTGFVYVSITESRRHIRAEMQKATLESEMAAAREVQRLMVPEDLPQINGYSIASVYLPASEVGGDFFQVIPLKSGRTLVVIGDVSGKGLRAAMIVSMIVGTLQTVSGYTEEPAEILGELNRRLCGRMHEGFATCLAVRIEENGRLTLANAGHLAPYLNGVEIESPGALPLGLAESADYGQVSLEMAVGDVIVLLTDGIAEAYNDQRVLFGFSRVESMLHEGATVGDVAETAQHYGQNDDITVLGVARL